MSTNGESESSSAMVLRLRSSDNEIFEVKKEVLLESITLKNLIEEDDCVDTIIPLPNVKGKIFSRIIQYCERHVEARAKVSGTEGAADSKEMKEFDSELVADDVIDLLLAANYLNIKDLFDLVCQKLADQIKEKPVEEVRKYFNIKNDFTPEEEEEVRNEYKWAFEEN